MDVKDDFVSFHIRITKDIDREELIEVISKSFKKFAIGEEYEANRRHFHITGYNPDDTEGVPIKLAEKYRKRIQRALDLKGNTDFSLSVVKTNFIWSCAYTVKEGSYNFYGLEQEEIDKILATTWYDEDRGNEKKFLNSKKELYFNSINDRIPSVNYTESLLTLYCLHDKDVSLSRIRDHINLYKMKIGEQSIGELAWKLSGSN